MIRDKRGQLTVHIDNGQVGTRDDHALTHDQSEASGTSSDNADLALERKGSKGSLHVLTAAALNEFARWKFMVLGILDGDGVVGSGKGSGFCCCRVLLVHELTAGVKC